MTGTIIRLIADKGFGFIKGDDGVEYFVHHSAVSGGLIFELLQLGQALLFDPIHSPKGPRAENVRLG